MHERIQVKSKLLDFHFEYYDIYKIKDDPNLEKFNTKEYLYIEDARGRMTTTYSSIYRHKRSGATLLAKKAGFDRYSVLYNRKKYLLYRHQMRQSFKYVNNYERISNSVILSNLSDVADYRKESINTVKKLLNEHWPRNINANKYYGYFDLVTELKKLKKRDIWDEDSEYIYLQ
jgi:hypothetical protein